MRALALVTLLAGATLAASAQTNTPVNVRRLSLQDCIQMTLSQNIGLQIARYNPQIALYALREAYGAYDPTLSLSGQHSHNESGSRLLSGGFEVPGATTEADSFTAGLGNGLTPWGMGYQLNGNVSDSYGRSFTVVSNSLVPSAFESSAGAASASVTQPLLKNFWIDGARLTIKTDKIGVKRADLALKGTVIDTVSTLEQAYYDLIAARENVLVRQTAVQLAEQLVTENRKRVEVGAMAPLDAKQAESQAATTRADLIGAVSTLGTQENVVRRLISSNYVNWAAITIEPTATLKAEKQEFNLQESWRRGLTGNPSILATRLDVEQSGILVKYSYNQLFPQLDVFATYGYNGSGREFSGSLFEIQQRDRPAYSYGGQISIPLANQSARNRHKSNKASFQQVVLGLKNAEEALMSEIDTAIGQARASYERVLASQAAREYAEDALSAEQKKLEQGKSTTYTVLLQQRDVTSARAAEIEAITSYNKTLSILSAAEGTTLERLGINWEAE